MKPYKIKIQVNEFVEFYKLTRLVFSDRYVREKISYLDFYNIAHLLKRMGNKIINNFDMPGNKKLTFLISPNEIRSFLDLLIIAPAYIKLSDHINFIISVITAQTHKQETDLENLKLIR